MTQNITKPLRTPRERAGITILEVLIAMGIAMIGLLAVMALVPFASRKAQAGLETDEAASLGRRALSEFRVHGMDQPANWLATQSPMNGVPPSNYHVFPSVIARETDQSNAPGPDPLERWFHDEAILIDPQFFGVHTNLGTGLAVSHFPYCYQFMNAPLPFFDPETGMTDLYREPLTSSVVPAGFSHAMLGGIDPLESIGPYVRRVGLVDPATGVGFMPNVLAREIFETLDDIGFRETTEAETAVLNGFETRRMEFLQGTDASSGNSIAIKPLAQGRTSWLPMIVPQNDDRTIWKLYIIVVRDRDPSFAMNLTNERVARVRGLNRYPTDTGFVAGGRFGGLVRAEAWGTTRLTVGGTTDLEYETMSKDVEFEIGQWVLLTRFDQFPGAASPNPTGRRVYQWYRVADVAPDIVPYDCPNPRPDREATGVVPSRMVTLQGPDWNPGPDALVMVMSNVVAVYERTITLSTNTFSSPVPNNP